MSCIALLPLKRGEHKQRSAGRAKCLPADRGFSGAQQSVFGLTAISASHSRACMARKASAEGDQASPEPWDLSSAVSSRAGARVPQEWWWR